MPGHGTLSAVRQGSDGTPGSDCARPVLSGPLRLPDLRRETGPETCADSRAAGAGCRRHEPGQPAPRRNAPPPEKGAEEPAAAPRAQALVGDATEREIRVETQDVVATFTNSGARMKSWRLKKYLDTQREPQELVENELPGQPLPFTLRTGDERLDRDAQYRVVRRWRLPTDRLRRRPTSGSNIATAPACRR